LAKDETNAEAQRHLWLSLCYVAKVVETKSAWQAAIDQSEFMKSKDQFDPQDEECYLKALENVKTARD
jgi:hypothetical protein